MGKRDQYTNDSSYHLEIEDGGTNANGYARQSRSRSRSRARSLPRRQNRFILFFRRRSPSRYRSTSPPATDYRPPTHTSSGNGNAPTSSSSPTSPPSRNSSSLSSPKRTSGSRNERQRYKGFSTSISSVFLDETLVCPSVSWCGLLSSSRTEHLLHVRSQRRKLNTTEFRGPSKILGTSLIFSVTGIVITYIIWGFGSGSGSSSEYYQQGYYYYGNNRKVEEQHYAPRVPNVMRLKDYRERFWIPFETVVEDILLQDQNQNEYSKGDFDSTPIGRSLQENFWNNQDIAYNLRSLFCIVFFLILGIFGRRRRMKTRFAVLKARLQDDKVFFGPLSANRRRGRKMDREDKYDGACSHTLCGCYPVDKVEE